ncbi:MAG TPA: hypothetical protein VM369_07830 [Candidatus Binatia bacterium]|nr:hypothetical protein [Candidatus Binatia bacterium]
MPGPSVLHDFNHARFVPGAGGFYESWFQRANHPSQPLAFWIRYTVFSPASDPNAAIGELWAVRFDSRAGHSAAKSEWPLARSRFSRDRLDVQIGESVLADGKLRGAANSGGRRIAWDLGYEGGQGPLLLMPPGLYARGFPRAKSLVGVPNCIYRGWIEVDGQRTAVDGWQGSQNHNWGVRHTDAYAYGQVCGFDDAADSFLEVATGRLRIGPWWTPRMTPVVLRHAGREYAFNSLLQSTLRARGRYGLFHWDFASKQGAVRIEGRIEAPREAFIGLRYANPPGGSKHCLNTKLARCELRLRQEDGREVILRAEQRAAFEILTDDPGHGVAIRA